MRLVVEAASTPPEKQFAPVYGIEDALHDEELFVCIDHLGKSLLQRRRRTRHARTDPDWKSASKVALVLPSRSNTCATQLFAEIASRTAGPIPGLIRQRPRSLRHRCRRAPGAPRRACPTHPPDLS